ncbi:MAG: hypothetical protein M3011_13995, partial [Actinomycetota bacterium]|nr:hypothetical protein [Actinomycetota bacterium]
MNQKVSVRRRGPAYQLDHVSSVLGLAGPEVPRQASPAIWVGDRLHNEATAWLENRYASLRNDRSVSTNAERLVGWIRFLGSRGQTVNSAGED